jgi:transmembrane 9 superfamily protein 2/4
MQALIRDNYKVDWMLDDLPAASVHLGIDGRRRISSAGFPLGYQKTGRTPGESKYFVYNHVALNVRYRVAGNGVSGTQMVVTGVEAYTKSIQHDWKASNLSFEGSEIAHPLELSLAEEPSQNSAFRDDRHFSIPYSYSVYFGKEDDDSIWWPNRWDKYLDGREEPLLRMAVIYAVLVALATFLLKTAATRPVLAIRYSAHIRILRKIGILRRQSSSNDLGKAETALKESLAPWKLIHRDVFRIPPSAPLLAPLVGSGMQLLFVVAEILLLGANGMFDPNTRGMIISVGIFLFVITGFGSGRTSAQLYKSLGGHLWLFNLLMTGILVPGLFYTTLFIINLFVWTQAASTAIPFGTLIVLLALWLGVQLPLVYLGGLVGHKVSKAWEHPIQPSSTPRRIPQQRWTLRNPQFIHLGGIIPLSVIGVAQIYIFHGLLPSANIDFSYGAAGIILFCLVLTTVHITIIGIWLQISHEVGSHLTVQHVANSVEL